MFETNAAKIRLAGAMMGLALLARCVTPPTPPPPPPPPPPPVKVIPPRPLPPGGATPTMYVPPRGLDGIRRTVNYGITTPQSVWNLRSALNVAALNCLDPRYDGLVDAYSSLLTTHKRQLARVNDQITQEYRAEYGRAEYRSAFDGYMTQVYNYFALPPAQRPFCDTAMQIASASLMVEEGGLEPFALANLPLIESVFDNFYTELEQYRVNVAAWDSQYAPASTFAPSAILAPTPTFVAGDGTDTVTAAPAASSAGFAPVIRSVEVAPSDTGEERVYTAAPYPAQAQPVVVDALPTAQTLPSVGAGGTGAGASVQGPLVGATMEAAAPESGAIPGFTITEQPLPEPSQEPVFISEPVVEPLPDEDG